MPIRLRLCVVAYMPRRPGEQLTSPYGTQSLRWLFDSSNHSSVSRYWYDVSGGQVDLTADYLALWRLRGTLTSMGF